MQNVRNYNLVKIKFMEELLYWIAWDCTDVPIKMASEWILQNTFTRFKQLIVLFHGTKQQKTDHLTRDIIPLCPISDAILKSFINGIGTVGLTRLHHRVVLGVRLGQDTKQTVVCWLAVVALLLVGGWVIKRITGNHSASVQVPWQHKSSGTIAYFSNSLKGQFNICPCALNNTHVYVN